MQEEQRYWLKNSWEEEYTEVTKEQYIKAERSCGFRSKFGEDQIATAAFSSGSVKGTTIKPNGHE